MEQLTPYQAARLKEDTLRLETWFDAKVSIGPFLVYQLTPYRYLALEVCGNAFVAGGIPTRQSVTEFLWIVSQDYSKPQRMVWLRNWLFGRRVRKALNKQLEDVILGIKEYMDNVLFDQPLSQMDEKQKKKESYASWLAYYVHTLCSKYPLKPNEILHMPIHQIFQLVRVNQEENNIPMINYLSEQAKAEMRR